PPLFKWTPHAKAQSIAEGAEKFALTLKRPVTRCENDFYGRPTVSNQLGKFNAFGLGKQVNVRDHETNIGLRFQNAYRFGSIFGFKKRHIPPLEFPRPSGTL
ncbi:hypothetical protein AAIH70_20515, partial [Neorhizobium sp. BT27B]|uniref:hypothetical protein n=1 Tax=Neorhizobium sp. BT27B TaxID=3142625 RepID=UPI003D2E5673